MKNQLDLPSTSDRPAFYLPNRMERVVLLAVEEILGPHRVSEVFNLAVLPGHFVKDFHPDDRDAKFSLEQITHMQAGLESAYGTRAGRGLAVRIGRACFKYSLSEFGVELGFSELSYRLLPLQAKLKISNEAFAALFNTITGQHICLETDEKCITWKIEDCPLCRSRNSEVPCCHLVLGWLQEVLSWASGGKSFEVEEQKCIACGDGNCTFVIERAPMG